MRYELADLNQYSQIELEIGKEIPMTRRHESLKVSDILQPSALQRAFWIYAGAGSGDPAILTVRFTVSGPVEDELLQLAWNATISQHEMLRATINKDKSNEPLLAVSYTHLTLPTILLV